MALSPIATRKSCFCEARGLLVHSFDPRKRNSREYRETQNEYQRRRSHVRIDVLPLMPAAPGFAAGTLLSRQDDHRDRRPRARRVGRFAAEVDITVFEKAFPGQPNIVTEYMTGGGTERPRTTSIESLVRTA